MKYFVVTALFLAFSASAGIVYRAPQPVESAEYLGTDSGQLVRFNLTALEAGEALLNGFGPGVVFRVPGGGYGAEIGTPDLPVIRRMVQIPATGGIELEIVSAETSVLGNYNVLPTQPFPERSGFQPPLRVNEDVYGASEYYPSSPVTLHSISILRDIRVAWVCFNPVQVNPVTGSTIVNTSVTVRLVNNGAPGENELYRVSAGVTRTFLPYYREVLGFQETDAIIDGSYLVIGSSAAVDLCADLIQWKREKGYNVQIGLMEDIGFSSSAVDAYIVTAFNTWANPPEYVLLLGDEVGVPAYWAGSIASDNQYGVIGTGVNPSIHVGRLCADTATLNYVSWKVWSYETDPYEPAASWFQYAISIGSNDFQDPLMSWRYKQIMANDGNMDVTLYCPTGTYGGINPTIALISEEINSGLSLISYIGHGSRTTWVTTGFSNSNVAALTNGRKLPWISSIACVNSQFADGGSGDCFGEAWLKSGSIATPRGAVGFMGATVNSPVGPTDSLALYQFKGYFQLDMYHMGQAFDYGKIKAYEYTGNASNSNMHMIMGDPEHDIFTTTGPLVHLSATYPSQVGVGSFAVNVTAGGSPVNNALVGLCQGSTVLASGRTNSSGAVTLSIPEVPGSEEVTLTVTAHNLYPMQVMVPTGVGTAEGSGAPVPGFHLGAAIPNPITTGAALGFSTTVGGHVSLQVFDLSGRVVRTLQQGDLPAGSHSLIWDGADSRGTMVPGGVYFYRLSTTEGTVSRSCVVVR